nr:unnamed protein product [Haemonchus contortus]
MVVDLMSFVKFGLFDDVFVDMVLAVDGEAIVVVAVLEVIGKVVVKKVDTGVVVALVVVGVVEVGVFVVANVVFVVVVVVFVVAVVVVVVAAVVVGATTVKVVAVVGEGAVVVIFVADAVLVVLPDLDVLPPVGLIREARVDDDCVFALFVVFSVLRDNRLSILFSPSQRQDLMPEKEVLLTLCKKLIRP